MFLDLPGTPVRPIHHCSLERFLYDREAIGLLSRQQADVLEDRAPNARTRLWPQCLESCRHVVRDLGGRVKSGH